MKTKLSVPKKLCRKCEYNEYRKCGVDYCIRAGCKYKTVIKDGQIKTEGKIKIGG